MSACGVDHQSKRRDMKIKSTFNISFQIHFVCFVLKIFIVSWILLVVAFNLLTPWCSFLQKGRLMKLCDGDCTIKKRNRQRCLILKPFPGSKCQDARAYFKPSEGNLLPVRSLVSISKVQPTASQSGSCIALHWNIWIHCLPPLHVPVKTRWYTGLRVVITQRVHTLHFNRPTDITGYAHTKEGRLYVRNYSSELSASLWAH